MLRELRSPYDGSVIAEIKLDDASDVERKLAAASDAFLRWRDVPVGERRRILEEGVSRFVGESERTAEEISRQMGKPILQARQEVQTFLDRARWALGAAEEALAPELIPEEGGLHRRIEHAPLGVVLDVAAWNYPLLVTVNVVLPALLAGNVVALKHSHLTPLTGDAFARAFGELEIPDLLVHLVVRGDVAGRLLDDPRIAHVGFTGSVETGRSVYRRAAERLIDVGLELGGKDPAYVAEDADLDTAVAGVVDGACYNAGQSCCAVERVYVHRSVYADFVERARSILEAYELGDPLSERTTMGPMATPDALETLETQVEDARSRGATVVCGGARVANRPGQFFPPTLVVDVPNDALLMQEESFGPVVPVLAVEDDEEGLARMQDTRFGLTASLWTQSRERAERLAPRIEAGTIFQNRCDFVDPALPWTGVGESGVGSTLSRHGFLGLTRRRSIHFR